MPQRPCLGLPGHPCGRLTTRTDSRCEQCASAHGRARDQARGNRHVRGYSSGHVRLRNDWRPLVEAELVNCSRCGELIRRGQQWALDHTDNRDGYRGPSHATCNNAAGGYASHK